LDQTASYSMDSVGYFPEIKETEVWSSPQPSAEIKNELWCISIPP
jgi:hypothetical protein